MKQANLAISIALGALAYFTLQVAFGSGPELKPSVALPEQELDDPRESRSLLSSRSAEPPAVARQALVEDNDKELGTPALDTQGSQLLGRVLTPTGGAATDAFVVLQAITGNSSSLESCRTNNDGEYLLGLDPAERWRISAYQAGFSAAREELDAWAIPERDQGSSVRMKDLCLGRGSQLGGRVTCEDGTPMPEIDIYAFEASEEELLGLIPDSHRARARTDSLGRFNFKGLAGRRATLAFESESGERALGPYALGSQSVELTYPWRALVVRLTGEAGSPLSNVEIEAALGFMEDDGSLAADSVPASVTQPPTGSAAFPIRDYDSALLRVKVGAHYFEETIPLALSDCLHRVDLTIPSSLPLGSLKLVVRDAAALLHVPYRLHLTESRERFSSYQLDGPGPHEVLAATYHGFVEIGDVATTPYLPLQLEDLRVRHGETLRLDRQAKLGGRLSLTLVLPGAAEGKLSRLSVQVRSDEGWSTYLHFYDATTKDRTDDLRSGVAYLADPVLPCIPLTLTVRLRGHGKWQQRLAPVAGEITTLSATLHQVDDK